ncbi:MAG: LPS export ABC transporter periplasmic protein LptC [Treponema sp.]
MKLPFALTIVCAVVCSAACTFNYQDSPQSGNKQPDMVFSNVTFRRYEDAQLDTIAHIKALEMYDSEKMWAAENIAFTRYAQGSDVPKESMTGTAGLMLIEEYSGTYNLGDTVSFHLINDDYRISSPALLFKKNDNLLMAPQDAVVTISHGADTKVEGKNFSANTQTKEYSFKKQTSGVITVNNAVR